MIDLKLVRLWEWFKPDADEKNEYLEIRPTPTFDIKTEQGRNDRQFYYNKLKELNKQLPNTIVKKQCQFFIQRFAEFIKIMEFDDSWLLNNIKICYGINTRWMDKEKNISGGYKNLRNFRFIFFDIDKVDHSNTDEWEVRFLDQFTTNVITHLEHYNLKHPTIINSGAGRHLLYRIEPNKITNGRKLWLKSWSKEIQTKFKNNMFELDSISDATRVFGLPYSMNVKRDARVHPVVISNFVSKFKFHSKKQPKVNLEQIQKDLPEIKDSLEFNLLMCKDLPKGSIHSTILFASKLFLKASGMSKWRELGDMINKHRGSQHDFNPLNGTEGKNYNKGIIINWCKNNSDWVKKHPKILELYKKYKTFIY